MARARDPFGLALETVRRRLRDGASAPGQPLIITELAQALNISNTPVREALAYLAGEGLVSEHRGRGYLAPTQTAADLAERYCLQCCYLELALKLGKGRAVLPAQAGSPGLESDVDAGRLYRNAVETLWASVAATADRPSLQRTIAQLDDQLALARLAEPTIFSGAMAELTALTAMLAKGEIEPSITALEAFHRRRYEGAADLARALREPGTRNILQI